MAQVKTSWEGEHEHYCAGCRKAWSHDQQCVRAPRARCAGCEARRGDGRVFQRGGSWWFAYYKNGREYRESGGGDKLAAALKLRQRLAEIRTQTFVGPQQERLKVGAILDAYLTDRRLAELRSIENLEVVVKGLRAAFGDWRAIELTLPRMKTYVTQRLTAGVARGTIKVRLAILSAAFTITRRDGMHRLRPDFPRLTVQNARTGFFSMAEFDKVHAALPSYLRDVALFGYLTGWRKREILDLSWAEVDRAGSTITLGAERSKNGWARTLPLAGPLVGLIERRWKGRVVGRFVSPYVFHRRGRRIMGLNRAWASACAEADIPGRLFHDLRRTAIRNMVRDGFSEAVCMKMSGHRSRSVFNRYNIASTEDLTQALEKADDRVRRLSDGRRDGQQRAGGA